MSISTLPPEILGEIFTHIQIDPLSIPFRHGDQRVVLTKVCRHWHAAVFSTPSLWTHIIIRFTDPLRLPKFIEVAQQCLSRAGNFPVTLNVLVHSPNSIRVTPSILSDEVVQKLIRPNAHRWQKLTLLIAPESFDKLLALPIGSFSNLKELSARINSKYPETTPLNTLSTGLARSPLLTHLKLSTLGSEPVNAWHLQCPWKQMTNIDLSAFKITDDCCHAILRECYWLEAVLVCTTPPLKSLDISHPIILPRLRSLSVAPFFRINNDFSTFFIPLVPPNLKYFYFNSFRVDSDVSLRTIDFQAFQTRSNFQLEHLELKMADRDRPAFHDMLLSCPSLLKLQIPNQWFLKGNKNLTRGVVIPKLEHLVLTSDCTQSPELLAIIGIRTRPGYPFPLKCLEGLNVNNAELRRRFREFISRGLRVS